jgi:hypothetical protein
MYAGKELMVLADLFTDALPPCLVVEGTDGEGEADRDTTEQADAVTPMIEGIEASQASN